MKRNTRKIVFLSVLFLLLILVFPLPTGTFNDGGTREFTALTYKLVRWNRLIAGEDSVKTYSAWRIYPVPLNFSSIDELWEREVAEDPGLISDPPSGTCFYATVTEVRENRLLVDGLDTNGINYRYEFSLSIGDDTVLLRDGVQISLSDFQIGDPVLVEFTGQIREGYPARIINVISVAVSSPVSESDTVKYSADYIRIGGSGGLASVFLPFAENDGAPVADGKNRLPVIRIDSKAELYDFISGLKGTEAYKETSLWSNASLFDTFSSSYDETFFRENSLLFVYIYEGSGSIGHSIYDISVSNGICTVTVESISPESGTCDMADWLISLEVTKASIANCTSFDAGRL